MTSPAHLPVLLVHGFNDRPSKFRYLERRLRAAGYETHAVTLRPAHASCGLDALARQVNAYIQEYFQKRHFVLLGFSMGGLVCRAYLQKLRVPAHKVSGLITIASPHRGTWSGYLLPLQGPREMRRGSAWLAELNSDLSTLESLPFYSFWTPLDLMILPASSSSLGIGKEARFLVPLHPLMLFNKKVAGAVLDALNQIKRGD